MSTSTTFTVPEGYSPPFAIISDSDHGGWIIIATALGITMVLLSTAIRLYVKWASRQPAGIDDFLLAAGIAIALFQESVVLAACHKGLGRKVDLLDASSLIDIEKSIYSSQILAVIALGLCKCSIACFILRLTPQTSVRTMLWAIIVCTTAWVIAAILAFALQCDLDNPWSFVTPGKCHGLFPRVLAIAAIDIALEIALFASAVFLVARLQTPLSKKAMVVLAFGLRLPIVGFTAARIATANIYIGDFAFTESLYIIWTVTEVNYSLLSTTLPLLRPFIRDLATYYGTMTPSVYDESSSRSRSNSYPLAAFLPRKYNNTTGSKGSMPSGRRPSVNQEGTNILDFGAPPSLGLAAVPQCETHVEGGHSRRSEEANSLGHNSSQRMIIHVETEWAVER